MLSLSNVSLNIPIFNNQRRTIKNIISNTVGSVIRKEASKKSTSLNLINCKSNKYMFAFSIIKIYYIFDKIFCS